MRTTAKMELRRTVIISSSWDVCEEISAVLYIVSSSGSLLDEPLSAGHCPTPICLTAPTSDPNQPCRLHIDLSGLRGYVASQIELTTSSRTTELYYDNNDDDEYIGTVRGTVAGTCDSNKGVRKLYICDHVLPSDSPHQKFSIKLLSLRGMREVLVDKIQLAVTADHGGSATTHTDTQRQRAVQRNGMDMQQLLGSLPVGSIPPFMQTLVSSLTRLTTQAGPGQHHACLDDERRVDRPPEELSKLMDTLKHMRPAPVETAPSTASREEKSNVLEDVSDGAATSEEGDLTELEKRLRRYIDDKFEELERRLVERLEELLVNRHTETVDNSTTGRES